MARRAMWATMCRPATTLNGVALGASAPPALTINNVTVNDGTAGATAAFTVTLSQAAATAVTVGLRDGQRHRHGRHRLQGDFRHADLQPGYASPRQSTCRSTPTPRPRATCTFQVNLSDAVGATLATTSGTGTIVDTIAPPTSSAATASFEVTSDWGTGLRRPDHAVE